MLKKSIALSLLLILTKNLLADKSPTLVEAENIAKRIEMLDATTVISGFDALCEICKKVSNLYASLEIDTKVKCVDLIKQLYSDIIIEFGKNEAIYTKIKDKYMDVLMYIQEKSIRFEELQLKIDRLNESYKECATILLSHELDLTELEFRKIACDVYFGAYAKIADMYLKLEETEKLEFTRIMADSLHKCEEQIRALITRSPESICCENCVDNCECKGQCEDNNCPGCPKKDIKEEHDYDKANAQESKAFEDCIVKL